MSKCLLLLIGLCVFFSADTLCPTLSHGTGEN